MPDGHSPQTLPDRATSEVTWERLRATKWRVGKRRAPSSGALQSCIHRFDSGRRLTGLVAKVDLRLLRSVCGQAVADPRGGTVPKPVFVVLAVGVQPRAGDCRGEIGTRAERRAAARVDSVDQLWLLPRPLDPEVRPVPSSPRHHTGVCDLSAAERQRGDFPDVPSGPVGLGSSAISAAESLLCGSASAFNRKQLQTAPLMPQGVGGARVYSADPAGGERPETRFERLWTLGDAHRRNLAVCVSHDQLIGTVRGVIAAPRRPAAVARDARGARNRFEQLSLERARLDGQWR